MQQTKENQSVVKYTYTYIYSRTNQSSSVLKWCEATELKREFYDGIKEDNNNKR